MPRRPGLDQRILVSAAAELADEGGLELVTIASLAARLNVRPPSLYNHIESAGELHHQLTLFALRSLCDAASRAAVGRNGPGGVLAVANVYREYAQRHPGLYGATLRAAPPGDAAMQRISTEFLDIMRAVLVPFDLGETDLIHAVRGFRSVVHGFVSLEAAHGFGLPQSIDDSFHFVIRSFIQGLGVRSDA